MSADTEDKDPSGTNLSLNPEPWMEMSRCECYLATYPEPTVKLMSISECLLLEEFNRAQVADTVIKIGIVFYKSIICSNKLILICLRKSLKHDKDLFVDQVFSSAYSGNFR